MRAFSSLTVISRELMVRVLCCPVSGFKITYGPIFLGKSLMLSVSGESGGVGKVEVQSRRKVGGGEIGVRGVRDGSLGMSKCHTSDDGLIR